MGTPVVDIVVLPLSRVIRLSGASEEFVDGEIEFHSEYAATLAAFPLKGNHRLAVTRR